MLPLAALDTETTGPDFYHGCRPFLIGYCTEDSEMGGWQFEVDPYTRTPHISSHEIQEIQEFVDSHRLIFHNTKFDLRALESIGIDISDVWGHVEDTLVASHVIRSNMPHGLKPLSDYYLDVDTEDQQELRDAVVACRALCKHFDKPWRKAEEGDPHFPGITFSGSTTKWGFDMWLPRTIALRGDYLPDHPYHTVCSKYNLQDAERTMALYFLFIDMLKEDGMYDLYKVRKQMLEPLYDMEEKGITFNMDKLHETKGRYEKEVEIHTAKCKKLVTDAGGSIENLGSFKQLQTTVFETLKIPETIKTKTGFSTKKDELAKVQVHMNPRSRGYKFIDNLAAVTQRSTAVTYLSSYERFCLDVDEPDDPWKILHPSFNLTGTRTTRQSSKWPNAQNISKKEGFNLRSIFGPVPGRVWYAPDYANVELRILAWASEERSLMDAFLDGESIHMMFARIVCPDLIKKAGGEEAFKKTDQYRYVKNGNFSLTYGASRATADATYKIAGAYDKVRSYFTKLDTYMDATVSLARRQSYVTTLMANGPGYPLWVEPRKAYTQAVDYVCQGTAGWCMALAIIKCHDYLRTFPDHHMIMTIHDELVFDFPSDDDRNGYIIADCCHLMEDSGKTVGVPTPVELDIITNTWDKGVEYAISS